jgi:HEPN domain-containing protein
MTPVPLMRRQFQRLAELRAGEALVLVQNRKEQGAYYLAGYAVECALKACIAKLTKRNEFPLKPEYVRKTYTHDLSELLRLAGLEKQLEIDMSLILPWRSIGLSSRAGMRKRGTSQPD